MASVPDNEVSLVLAKGATDSTESCCAAHERYTQGAKTHPSQVVSKAKTGSMVSTPSCPLRSLHHDFTNREESALGEGELRPSSISEKALPARAIHGQNLHLEARAEGLYTHWNLRAREHTHGCEHTLQSLWVQFKVGCRTV